MNKALSIVCSSSMWSKNFICLHSFPKLWRTLLSGNFNLRFWKSLVRSQMWKKIFQGNAFTKWLLSEVSSESRRLFQCVSIMRNPFTPVSVASQCQTNLSHLKFSFCWVCYCKIQAHLLFAGNIHNFPRGSEELRMVIKDQYYKWQQYHWFD